jgi:hypothetical protein
VGTSEERSLKKSRSNNPETAVAGVPAPPSIMSLLSWNCRGLGNPRTVHALCHLVKEKRTRFLFLMETKICKQRMQVIRNKLGFEGLLAVDPVGLSGGIALLWKEDCEVSIQNYSRRHINAAITLGGSGPPWKLTGFYGHPDRAFRDDSWHLLVHLKSLDPSPWLCVGDFNEITDLQRNQEVLPAARAKWKGFGELWRIVSWATWAIVALNSPGIQWAGGQAVSEGAAR